VLSVGADDAGVHSGRAAANLLLPAAWLWLLGSARLTAAAGSQPWQGSGGARKRTYGGGGGPHMEVSSLLLSVCPQSALSVCLSLQLTGDTFCVPLLLTPLLSPRLLRNIFRQ